jgi:hypothetical protein
MQKKTTANFGIINAGNFLLSVAALLVGCFIGAIHANWREEFEFNDSSGNCWRCTPGKACERCTNRNPLVDLPDISDICMTPNCEDMRVSGHLSVVFPHVNTRLMAPFC